MNNFSNTSSTNCSAILGSYVQNLTASYADKSNEASMVATSAVMFVLAALFFILNLFSRVSDVSAILHPTVRLFLSSSLSLFLPVMSYLFSEAKNEPASSQGSNQTTELSLRARTILAWMLLVELLRKKVEAILVTASAGMQGYSSTIDRAARIGWLGYLVFFHLKSVGKKTIYGFLWVLAAAKLVQRVAINELLKRSFAYGKNAQLLHSYMAHIVPQEQDQQDNVPDGSELLKRCKYAVMGEEELEMEAGTEGQPNKITVGEIWILAERDQLLRRDHRLKRLCLSFALYKLLRRRLENFHFTDAEARNCRDLIFRGLCRDGTDSEAIAVALFQVLNDELHFLCEYYHSVLPVVLSNPFFLVANYILFPIIVSAFFLLTIILSSNGDLFYAFHSIKNDNLVISAGITKTTGCILATILQSPPALFSTMDLAITMLLVLTFVYEEVWEFVVFILSNWFMVSLLRDYAAKPHWRESPTFRGTIGRILWVRNSMSHPKLRFSQLSVLGGFLPCRHPLAMPATAVPKEVKKSIMEYLLTHVDCHAPLSNGWSVLAKHYPEYHSQLSWACQSDSAAEVILAWHIATCLMEVRYPREKGTTSFRSDRTVATTLSKYCAYLVAFNPELLPDGLEGTQRAYDAMKRELKEALGCWSYFLPEGNSWRDKVLQVAETPVPVGELEAAMPLLWKGAKAGKILMSKAEADEVRVWKLLADVWTELIVYAAPSTGEVPVKAHGDALAKGVEFITVLWALATHTGITRPAIKPWAAIPVDHVEGTTLPEHACV